MAFIPTFKGEKSTSKREGLFLYWRSTLLTNWAMNWNVAGAMMLSGSIYRNSMYFSLNDTLTSVGKLLMMYWLRLGVLYADCCRGAEE